MNTVLDRYDALCREARRSPEEDHFAALEEMLEEMERRVKPPARHGNEAGPSWQEAEI